MFNSSVRRLVTALVTAMIGFAALFTTAAPAHAAVGYPTGAGLTQLQLQCLPGKIWINPTMAVTSGFTNGQYMVWRYHLTNSDGYAGTSGWSSSKLMPYKAVDSLTGGVYYYALTMHSQVGLNVPTNKSWGIRVQVGRWIPGYGYAYTDFLYPTEVTTISTTGRIYTSSWNTCTT